MSKTLPAAIVDLVAGDSKRVLLVRVIPESGDSWAEYDWATKDITVTAWDGGADKSFVGGVLKEDSFTPISQSVDVKEGGNIGTIGGLTFKLANPQFNEEARFDEAVDTYNFENRIVEIWLAPWTGTDLAYTDILLLYRGVVVDTSHEYGVYEFRVESADVKRHRTIPGLVLNFDDYPYLPQYNVGKVVPLFYGQLCGSGIHMNDDLYTPAILVEKGKGKYIVSANKMAVYGDVNLAIYHQDTGNFATLYTVPDVDFPINYARPTTFDIVGTATASLRSDYYGHGVEEGDRTSNFYGVSIKTVLDRLAGTGLLCDSTYAKIYVRIPIPREIGSLGLETAGNFVLKVSFGNIGGGVTGTVRYYNPEYDNGVGGYSTGQAFTNADADNTVSHDFGIDKSAHGIRDDQGDQGDIWRPEELSAYQWGLDFSIPALQNLVIYEIYIKLQNVVIRSRGFTLVLGPGIEYRPGPSTRGASRNRGGLRANLEQDNVCMWSQGEEFGTWIGSRSTDYESGDLIDAGVWHVEAILRSELGMGDSDINMDSFDVIGNNQRDLWPLANVVTEQKSSLDHIAEFCRNAAIIFFTDYQHKAKVVGLYKGASPVKTIDRTTIREDTIKVGLSPLDQVYNEFEITYGRHWLSGAYRKVKTCDASTHNMDSETRAGTPNTYTGLCADSQTKYNMTRKFPFVADWASEQTDWGDGAAETLLKWFAEWFCYRRWIVEFETDGLDHIDLELGDQVKVDHTLLPDTVSDTSHFMLFDTKHDLNKDRLKLKFVQIPDLLP